MNTVHEILNQPRHREIYSVLPDQSVLSVAQFLRFKNIGAVAVVQDNVLLGVVTERDLLNKVLSPGLDPRDVPVREVMSRDLTCVSPDETFEDCLIKFRSTHCRHLPVVQNGRLIGMISLRDVLGVEAPEVARMER